MISQISFKGTYRVDFNKNPKKEDEIFSVENAFCLCENFKSYYDFPVKKGDDVVATFVIADKKDAQIEDYLAQKGINYKKVSNQELLGEKNIKARIVMPEGYPKDDFNLVEVDTKKFNEYYKKYGFSYVGDKNSLEFPQRYQGFREYLKSGRKIDAPQVFVNDNHGHPEISFLDGRHRYAFLRDMGMQKIPVVMDRDSQNAARRFGLV